MIDILDFPGSVFNQTVGDLGYHPQQVSDDLYEKIFRETAGSGSAFHLLFAQLSGTTETTDFTRSHAHELGALLRATDEDTALLRETPTSVAEWMARHRPEGVRIATGDTVTMEQVTDEPSDLHMEPDMTDEQIAEVAAAREHAREDAWAALRAEREEENSDE